MLTWNDFLKVDIRVGTIIDVKDFRKAKNPSYKLTIDFGPLGRKKSSAQITKLYSKEELINKQILAVINFPPKQIADFMSEVLILGVVLQDGKVVMVHPERNVPNGGRIA